MMDALAFDPIFFPNTYPEGLSLLLVLNDISSTYIIFRSYGQSIQHDRKDQFARLAC
jgi:hypothetical protein